MRRNMVQPRHQWPSAVSNGTERRTNEGCRLPRHNRACKLPDYVIARINSEASPKVLEAERAKALLLSSLPDLIRSLPWDEFELLVELIFARSGWQRISRTGGTQKTIDMELLLPTTKERAFVQVKSQATQRDFAEYIDEFDRARG